MTFSPAQAHAKRAATTPVRPQGVGRAAIDPPSPEAARAPAPESSAGRIAVRGFRRLGEKAAVRFLRDFLGAVVGGDTYDLKRNPTLWVGFVMALPIPFITFASGGPAWLMLLSIPAPFFWAVVVGAAGRAGIRQFERSERLEREIVRTLDMANLAHRSYEQALNQEVERRRSLEQRELAVVSDLQLAEAVHRTLIPSSIQRPDVEVAVRHIPTEYVGGDYLFATIVDQRWLYLVMGDVSGHGVAAALVVARLHGLIRRLTLENQASPVTILDKVNRAALQLFRHTYFFMTMGVFRLDLKTGRLRYATAGHPAQCLLRGDGSLELLRTPNRLLGIDGDIFDSERPGDMVQMAPGDTVVLFTDGLYEILSGAGGEMLGEEALQERIKGLSGLEPALLAGEILQELADFQGRSNFGDDVSLMVATWEGPTDGDPSYADNQDDTGP